MTMINIVKDCDKVIKIGRVLNGQLIKDVEVLKERHEDCQSRKVSEYPKHEGENNKLKMDLISVIIRLEEQIPGVMYSIMSDEVIIGLPGSISIIEALTIINKVMV